MSTSSLFPTVELPSLWDHQGDMRDGSREGLRRHRRVILSAPPGTGKTRIAKWILGASLNRNPSENQTGRSLFCVHKRGLVDNASDSFHESPVLPHGIVMSGSQTAWGHRVQVGSIDTLLSWLVKDNRYNTSVTFDLIVFDETHSHLPKLVKFLKTHDAMRQEQGKHPAFLLGLTATPQAKGLSDIYADIVPSPSPQWLIDHGYLSKFRYIGGTKGQLNLLKRHGVEFTKKSVDAAMLGMEGNLLRDWKKYAEGRPTVGFFPRRSHAKDAQKEMKQAGLRVAYIDGETDDDERRFIFDQMDDGRLDYLCNVQVVERGTDLPCIACVQLCVAIGSLTRYLQMIGRGSRLHPDKEDCLVLDHGGNVARHGLFEDDPMWSLDRSRGKAGEIADRPTIECPECHAIYRGGRCRQCGYTPKKKEYKAQGLEWDGVELRPITKKQRVINNAPSLMVSCLYRAGKSGKTWRQAVGLFKHVNEQQGTNFRVPKSVVVGGHRYETLRYGDDRGGRAVKNLFPFTVGGPHGEGDFYLGKEP